MYIFFKANIASIIASLFDYAVTITLVYFLNTNIVLAGVTGNVCGGILNFIIARYWAFDVTKNSAINQGYKYAVVWTGNLLLNALGLYFLNSFGLMHYTLAKMITALVVAVTYNYPLQKNYVFRKN
jgi:putative flippase GtrA